MFFIQNKSDRIEILYDVNDPNKVMSKASTGYYKLPVGVAIFLFALCILQRIVTVITKRQNTEKETLE